jgi:TolB-like protein/Flp pilus assembly protein TadD
LAATGLEGCFAVNGSNAAAPVFISYSSKQAMIADQICAALEGAGVGCWIAHRDGTPGVNYGEFIIDAINGCKLVVLVFSADANESEQVLAEIERARSKRIAVITFRVQDILPTKAMEYFLSSQHWLNAVTPPIEEPIKTLTDIVKRMADVGYAPARVADIGRRAAIAAVAVAAPLIGGMGWWLLRRDGGIPMDSSAMAVLPFDNNSGDQALAYMSQSVPDELIRLLTNLTSFTVRPFHSVLTFVQDHPKNQDPGSGLGVGHTVSGSFSRTANGLALGVSIVDEMRQQQIWSDSFQADPAHLTGLMELVVAKVGSVLQVQMGADNIRSAIGCDNDQAYILYLRAISLEQEITRENNARAIQALQQSIALEPNFARAHAALAECYVTGLYWNLSTGQELLDQAETAARKAISLRPDLAESHYALAYTLEEKGRPDSAILEYFASLRANPRYPRAVENVARYLFYMAEFDRSIEMWDALARIDTTSNKPHLRRAMCYFFKGDLGKAATENALAEKFARGVDELTLCAFTYTWLKDFTAAQRVLDRLAQSQPSASQLAEVRAWIFTQQGKIAAAREQMKEMLKADGGYGIQDEIATLYAIQGDREQAIAWLTRAVTAGAPVYAWYNSDFFKSVQGDPRYQAVLKKLSDEYAPLKKRIPTLR